MKRSLYLVISIIMLASLLVGCAPKQAETGSNLGPSVLKVTGSIENKNSGDAYVFDEAAFEKQSVDRTMDDAWMGNGLNYRGILLSDIVKTVKPASGATTITVICTDKKQIDVPIEDANKWEILMAHYQDGKIIPEKNGGPVKIVFPADARTKYTDEMWMWYVIELNIK